MTKDQLNQLRKEFPREVELTMDDMYQWTTSALVNELLRWMPKSEFVKYVNQWEQELKEDGSE